jgi:hypothetical protein
MKVVKTGQNTKTAASTSAAAATVDQTDLTRAAALGSLPAAKNPSGATVKVALQRTNLEVAPEVGFYALRRGNGT